MITLNLTATTMEEKALKEYLEQNVSEILAEKINSGVPVEKDGKRLISKKTIKSFMEYATQEAQKQAQKPNGNDTFMIACLHSDIVFGWAIHYFEEDSILGVLYNEDGSEYKAPKPAPKPKKAATTTATDAPAVVSAPAPKKANPTGQLTMFDFMDEPTEDETTVDETVEDTAVEVAEQPTEVIPDEVEQEPVIEEKPPEKPKISPLYETYMQCKAEFPNTVVAMRVGDFFEIFGEEAVTVAKELEMTLTSRDFGLAERVPMIGYPYHTADTYCEKIRVFANIAVIDGGQMNFYPKIEPVKNEPAEVVPADYTVNEETGEVIDVAPVADTKEPQSEDPYADMDLMYKIYMLLDQKIDIVK